MKPVCDVGQCLGFWVHRLSNLLRLSFGILQASCCPNASRVTAVPRGTSEDLLTLSTPKNASACCFLSRQPFPEEPSLAVVRRVVFLGSSALLSVAGTPGTAGTWLVTCVSPASQGDLSEMTKEVEEEAGWIKA